MKKWLAIFVAVATLAGLLAGCGGSTTTDTSTTAATVADTNNDAPANDAGNEATTDSVTVYLRTECTNQATGLRTVYTYNGNGQLIQLEEYLDGEQVSVTEYSYYDNGTLAKDSRTTSDSDEPVVTTYAYNDQGDPTSVTRDALLLSKWTYEHDASGNKTKATEAYLPTNETREYQYDASGKLTQKLVYGESTPATLYEYTYDANGNKTKETVYAYNQETEERTENTWTEYTYDANGCLTGAVDADGNATTYTHVEKQLTAEQIDTLLHNTPEADIVLVKK